MSNGDKRIVVALDYPTVQQAAAMVDRLDPSMCRVKVGKQLFTNAGPAFVENLAGRGFDVFLDLKFHDIPNTVAGACRAAMDLGVWMLNVHAGGGRRMMEAARDAIDSSDTGSRPLLIAVTVLTSLSADELHETGVPDSPEQQVVRLARLAEAAGVDGVVCSPREIAPVRARTGEAFQIITPGIRPAGADQGDQRRVMTPAQAIEQGADYIVIGRPVTQADRPLDMLKSIAGEMAR